MSREGEGEWFIPFVLVIAFLGIMCWIASSMVKACVWFDWDKEKKEQKKDSGA
jgi:hypothetical protein